MIRVTQAMKQEEAERRERELRWRAESDAEALVRANEVALDPDRAKRAKTYLAEQQKANVLRAQASAKAMKQLGGNGGKTATPKKTAPQPKKAQPAKASANKPKPTNKKGGK